MFVVRTPEPSDWPAILATANAAAPGASAENEEWLANRRAFPERQRARRHFVVADDASAAVIGYGAIEETEPAVFRVFVVTSDDTLPSAGELLHQRLIWELRDLRARLLWVRERARDVALLEFFRQHGLCERERRNRSGGGEIVVLEQTL
jgi:L-amino acid N-acyltransferase YncA